jgi:hypothetical protein
MPQKPRLLAPSVNTLLKLMFLHNFAQPLEPVRSGLDPQALCLCDLVVLAGALILGFVYL